MEPREQTRRLAHRDQRRPVLVSPARVDLATQVMGDELHAVADAEHGDAGAQRLGVDLRRALLVNACRPPAQDEPGGVALFQLRPRRRPGYEPAVPTGLAHPPRAQLAELRAAIEDLNPLLAGRASSLLARVGHVG